jgi:hypothetical protein
MHCVVANELHSRHDRVLLISLSDDQVGAVISRQKASEFSLKVRAATFKRFLNLSLF